MSKYVDETTEASNPGQLTLSPRRLAAWRAGESIWQRLRRLVSGDPDADRFTEHLRLGDSRAAVVVSESPLLIAAYTDELDCVAMLKFDPALAKEFGLKTGARLLTVNIYFSNANVAPDLVPGIGAIGNWQNFRPVIAEFMSDDSARIRKRKAEIAEAEWERCAALGSAYLRLRPNVARDGSPFACATPAKR